MGNKLREFLENSVSGDSTHQGKVLSPLPQISQPYNYHMALVWMEWCVGHEYCHEKCPKSNYEDCFSHLINDWEIWLKIKKSRKETK